MRPYRDIPYQTTALSNKSKRLLHVDFLVNINM